LRCPALSEQENVAVYGKCSNPEGHGHNYVLEVRVCGAADPRTGRLMSIGDLDRLVEEEVLSRLRHRNLNVEAAGLAGAIPTTENLAAGIRAALLARWAGVFAGGAAKLDRVRVCETRRNCFETQCQP
jgi:6-pyruvoyltetrahydropterin/6-carboxytetrahydropterin synthase